MQDCYYIDSGDEFVFCVQSDVFQQGYVREKKHQDRKNRNRELLKALVLDYHLKDMYEFFSNLNEQLVKLKVKTTNRKSVESQIQRIFKDFNENFISFVDATIHSLGGNIKKTSDTMFDDLIENISDKEVNLWEDKYYDDRIGSVFNNGKKSLINQLFKYDGE